MVQLILFHTAKLAKEKGFDKYCYHYWIDETTQTDEYYKSKLVKELSDKCISAPTQEELKKYVRENRGVHIEIHRNASGYYWSMCKSDGGTDLGWSENSGPNMGGVWDEYENALENALQVQLSYDLPLDKKVILHWSNYAEFAREALKLI